MANPAAFLQGVNEGKWDNAGVPRSTLMQFGQIQLRYKQEADRANAYLAIAERREGEDAAVANIFEHSITVDPQGRLHVDPNAMRYALQNGERVGARLPGVINTLRSWQKASAAGTLNSAGDPAAFQTLLGRITSGDTSLTNAGIVMAPGLSATQIRTLIGMHEAVARDPTVHAGMTLLHQWIGTHAALLAPGTPAVMAKTIGATTLYRTRLDQWQQQVVLGGYQALTQGGLPALHKYEAEQEADLPKWALTPAQISDATVRGGMAAAPNVTLPAHAAAPTHAAPVTGLPDVDARAAAAAKAYVEHARASRANNIREDNAATARALGLAGSSF